MSERNRRILEQAQREYDAMEPPEYYENGDDEIQEGTVEAGFEDGFNAAWEAFKEYVRDVHPDAMHRLTEGGMSYRKMVAYQKARNERGF